MYRDRKEDFIINTEKKKIALLGSTGSIGIMALDVMSRYRELYEVVALAAGANIDLLLQQVKTFHPRIVSIRESAYLAELQQAVDPFHGEAVAGREGLLRIAQYPEADMVISAVSGASGLVPTYEAILAGKDIALANKETLVMAGEIIIKTAHERGVQIFPVDSEHSAIFQCLQGQNHHEIKKLLLTASGGPFFFTPLQDFEKITYEKALEHPTWSMGEKVSLDSATLMNKALEVIEAKWLFQVPIEKIEVVIHPESIIHSMVEFCDGNMLALLSRPDMRLPILYALSYPKRLPLDLPSLDFPRLRSLSFYSPDLKRFPCLQLGYEVAGQGKTMPAVLNAANEIALIAFRQGKIGFSDIPRVVEKTLEHHQPLPLSGISDALWADEWARKKAWDIIGRLS